MKTREKRIIKIDIYFDTEYQQTIEIGFMTARQGIAAAEKIARGKAHGNHKHTMVFVHAGELAIAHMTVWRESENKRIQLSKVTYNI